MKCAKNGQSSSSRAPGSCSKEVPLRRVASWLSEAAIRLRDQPGRPPRDQPRISGPSTCTRRSRRRHQGGAPLRSSRILRPQHCGDDRPKAFRVLASEPVELLLGGISARKSERRHGIEHRSEVLFTAYTNIDNEAAGNGPARTRQTPSASSRYPTATPSASPFSHSTAAVWAYPPC